MSHILRTMLTLALIASMQAAECKPERATFESFRESQRVLGRVEQVHGPCLAPKDAVAKIQTFDDLRIELLLNEPLAAEQVLPRLVRRFAAGGKRQELLTPEGLPEGLSDQQLRDFFAYIRISQPISK